MVSAVRSDADWRKFSEVELAGRVGLVAAWENHGSVVFGSKRNRIEMGG